MTFIIPIVITLIIVSFFCSYMTFSKSISQLDQNLANDNYAESERTENIKFSRNNKYSLFLYFKILLSYSLLISLLVKILSLYSIDIHSNSLILNQLKIEILIAYSLNYFLIIFSMNIIYYQNKILTQISQYIIVLFLSLFLLILNLHQLESIFITTDVIIISNILILIMLKNNQNKEKLLDSERNNILRNLTEEYLNKELKEDEASNRLLNLFKIVEILKLLRKQKL